MDFREDQGHTQAAPSMRRMDAGASARRGRSGQCHAHARRETKTRPATLPGAIGTAVSAATSWYPHDSGKTKKNERPGRLAEAPWCWRWGRVSQVRAELPTAS